MFVTQISISAAQVPTKENISFQLSFGLWKGELFVGVIAAYNFQITFVIWLFIFVLQGDIYVFDLFQLIISDKIKELIQGVIATKI